jgi:hypothetical protein
MLTSIVAFAAAVPEQELVKNGWYDQLVRMLCIEVEELELETYE